MTETLERSAVPESRLFRIRVATVDDAEELVAYLEVILADRRASIADLDEMMLDVPRQREHLRRIQTRADALALVAEHAGEIIGFLTMEPGRRRKVGHTAELGMSVREDWRGMGVGSSLIARAEGWARSTGRIRKICLNVFSENTAALGLYQKAGFAIEGRLRDQVMIDGKCQDLILMGKMLDAAPSYDSEA
jgi:RimJ/RimL family protein N-acetyltransferase